jgi:hypothetical protein
MNAEEIVMNRFLVAPVAAIGLIASASVTASAGVIVSRTESIVSGQIGPQQQPRQSTLTIQGNKQKMSVAGGRQIILDLDKSTMEVLDPTKKSYFELPFPPKGMFGQAIGGPGMHVAGFTKAGTSRTIAGYPCEDYKGTGQMPMGQFTTVYCVSTKAPGADEFSSFQKNMMAKLKDAQTAQIPSSYPDGIPMTEDTSTTISITNFGNLPPEMAAKLKAQFANRPPLITKAEVTKVEARKIEASEFEIPAGYTKSEPPTGRPGMGMGHTGGPMMGGAAGNSGGAPLTVAPPATKP